ncbi:MAG: sugar transferase [Bacteroidales bacterium]|nr:sugar transferase [Bacteroidales bacterium]
MSKTPEFINYLDSLDYDKKDSPKKEESGKDLNEEFNTTANDSAVVKKIITDESNREVFEYLNKNYDILSPLTSINATTSIFNIESRIGNNYQTLINLKRVNDIPEINTFFEAVNNKLVNNGLFIGCYERSKLRKIRIFREYPPVINNFYFFFSYIFKRVFPKIIILKSIHSFFTEGKNQILSKTEVLGRLYSCGFELVDEKLLNRKIYFTVRKIKKPFYDKNASYGFIFKMKRIGKSGKEIFVYKIRTMHPYSEYLQDYVYKRNKLMAGGKLKNDIRLHRLGKFLRKFWIDELPMIFNLLKGDLKIIGVRPLSEHYLGLYPDEIRNMRMKVKPGLIPPFYADLPKEFNEIIDSEKKYLEQYLQSPFKTDIKYFFKIMKNIIFKKTHSN